MRYIAVWIIALILLLALLDTAGHVVGWSHSKIFIGEQIALGFGVICGAALCVRLLRFLLNRQENYYDDLRERPPLIEARLSDWEQNP